MCSIIRNPGDERDLASLALAVWSVVFDIVDGVSATNALIASLVLALCAQKLLTELFVVSIGGLLLNNNLLPVIGDLVDDPLGGLAELQVVESCDTVGVD